MYQNYTPESFKVLVIMLLVIALAIASRVRNKEAAKPIWYKMLTRNEQYLYYWLAIIEGEGQMAQIIQNVCNGDSVADFRQLVSELKDQFRDAPLETLKLIGKAGVKELQSN